MGSSQNSLMVNGTSLAAPVGSAASQSDSQQRAERDREPPHDLHADPPSHLPGPKDAVPSLETHPPFGGLRVRISG
jgi:hypothetical protein